MKVLVCGSRGKFQDYRALVFHKLSSMGTIEIIEGCCKDSADQYAEEFCKEYGFPIHHYPSNEGNYIKRNVEMVDACDVIVAFFDGFSYGTSHTIAQGVMKKKEIHIIQLEREKPKDAKLGIYFGVKF